MTIARETTLSRNGDILYASVNTEEAVMLSISADRYYGLNTVAARIWELLETPMTVDQICARLCEEFEIDAQDCQSAVLKFADTVVDNGVIHAA